MRSVEKIPVNMKKAKISKLKVFLSAQNLGDSRRMNNVHMLDELVGTANIPETRETDLSNDGTELTACRGNTVRGRTVTSGERLTRDDEGSRVGPKVLEEVGKTVEEYEGFLGARSSSKFVVSET